MTWSTFSDGLALVGGVGLQVDEGLVPLLPGSLRVQGQGLVQGQQLVRDQDTASMGGRGGSGRETRSVSTETMEGERGRRDTRGREIPEGE